MIGITYVVWSICVESFFFSIWAFFQEHLRITRLQGKGEGISLTPHYYFHPLHRHLDISRAITAENSPLHIAGSRTRKREPLVSEQKSLTTKLRALKAYRFPTKTIIWINFSEKCFSRGLEKKQCYTDPPKRLSESYKNYRPISLLSMFSNVLLSCYELLMRFTKVLTTTHQLISQEHF